MIDGKSYVLRQTDRQPVYADARLRLDPLV